MDRHKAAETEIKSALKMVKGALSCLKLFADTEDEAPDWFRARILFGRFFFFCYVDKACSCCLILINLDAKRHSVRADAHIQNAYSLNTTLPELQPLYVNYIHIS
jgi:hypothetical protein